MVAFGARKTNPQADAVRRVAVPSEDGARDLDPLLDLVGDAGAVEPLERFARMESEEAPETYPSGV